LIPEITGVNFNIEHVEINGFNWCMTGSTWPYPNSTIPGSTHSEYNSTIDAGYIISIHPGGEPIPASVPEPGTIFLLVPGLIGLASVGGLKKWCNT
jgi:hypothetical protein